MRISYEQLMLGYYITFETFDVDEHKTQATTGLQG